MAGVCRFRSRELLLQVFQDFSCGVGARSARQSRARMRTAAAKIQVCDRGAVARPVEYWAHGEELVERQLAVEDLARCQTVSVFQIFGRDDLAFEYERRQIGRVLRE